MGGKYTESQAKAIKTYRDKTVAIQIRVSPEKRKMYQEKAKKYGMPLTVLIRKFLEEL